MKPVHYHQLSFLILSLDEIQLDYINSSWLKIMAAISLCAREKVNMWPRGSFYQGSNAGRKKRQSASYFL